MQATKTPTPKGQAMHEIENAPSRLLSAFGANYCASTQVTDPESGTKYAMRNVAPLNEFDSIDWAFKLCRKEALPATDAEYDAFYNYRDDLEGE